MNRLLVLLLITVTSFAFSDEHNLDPSVRNLSSHPTWLKLLGYSGNKSSITNKDFFLSHQGSTDPYKELIATLELFSQETPTDKQCKFPARYLWLKTQLNLKLMKIQLTECREYHEFSQQVSPESVSLIFATGYLGNPASYYGHLLIKLNSNQENSTELENQAINFGADLPPNENMMLYIFKGIFGGYQSSFTKQQYFYHAHNYGESELRDLWEYRLHMSHQTLELLTAHIWELLQADYTYFFFNRNCAYRVGKLLELVTDQQLVRAEMPWETPQAIMQKIQKTTVNGQPIVSDIFYHPSRQSRLYQRYKKLNSHERKLMHSVVGVNDGLEHPSFSQQPLNTQYKVVDALIDYYQFVRKKSENEKDPNNELYRKALSKRFQLPPHQGINDFSSSNQPHLGRKPSYTSIGASTSDDGEQIINLWLRPAYYDSLDSEYGHIKNAALSMGELKINLNDRYAYVKEINLVKIESLRRNFTKLPGDNHASWYLEAGAEQEIIGCEKCLASKLKGGYGYASSLFNDSVLIAGYTGGGFWGENLSQDNIFVSGRVTLNINLSNALRFQTEYEIREFEDRQNYTSKSQIRQKLSDQIDLRVFYSQDQLNSETGASIGFYW